MRTVEEIQSDISRVQQNQRKATAFIYKFNEALEKAQALEAEIDAVLPLVENVRNTLNDTNTSVKGKGKQLVGESGYILCLREIIEGQLHEIASSRYENIEYYYGQLKQMKESINISELQGTISKYSGDISQYQSELQRYQTELEEALVAGNG